MLNIRDNGIDLNVISSFASSLFHAGRTKTSHLLWLNRRWFSKAGFDTFDEDVFADLSNYLIEQFARCSIISLCDLNNPNLEVMSADRYGGPNGTLHGGSGRCGAIGHFHAKGIGPTPLVSKDAAYHHSHGLLPLEEAIREVIASELASAELSRGAVPIVAVIDAGLSVRLNAGGPLVRCAIMVRPNFVRVAHQERSIFFGSTGFIGSDQERDYRRAQDFKKWINTQKSSLVDDETLDYVTKLACDQVGTFQAHRLWPGRCTSDNVTIDGSIVEFGCYRSLPSWQKATDGKGSFFGSEDIQIQSFWKYDPTAARTSSSYFPEKRLQQIRSAIRLSFLQASCKAVGLVRATEVSRDFEAILIEEYEKQQRTQYHLDQINDHNPTCNVRSLGLSNIKMFEINPIYSLRFQNDLQSLVADYYTGDQYSIYRFKHRLSTWLLERPRQNYSFAKKQSENLVSRLTGHPARQRAILEYFISSEYSKSRRVFSIPTNYLVVGYCSDIASSVYYLYDPESGSYHAELKGIFVGGYVRIMGKQIPWHDTRAVDVGEDVSILISSISVPNADQMVKLNGVLILLPKPDRIFNDDQDIKALY